MTKVSVIIPCHNAEKYLSTCLNSVLNQTLDDIEVLAIDDHSTDNTLKILYSFQKEYSTKLRVFSLQEFRGVSAARNLGLKYAQGEFIGFVDADDLVTLNMFRDFYTVARMFKVPIVVGSNTRINESQFLNQETFMSQEVYHEGLIDYINFPLSFFDTSPACWNKIFNHDFILKTRFLEGKIFEDVGFVYPLLLKASTVYQFYRDDYFYRFTPGSIMTKLKEPNHKVLDMLDICLDMEKQAQIFQFDQSKCTLLKDCIYSYLLNSLSIINSWNISFIKKILLIQKLILVYEYYFPKLRQFESFYARFANDDLRKEFEKYFSLPIFADGQIQKFCQDVAILIKSLENSSHS